jgi:hypothetical protein
MNWPLAIARNRTALLAVVAAIVALIGGREGGPISRRVRNAALALLRPAESAARRLIVIAARGLVVLPRPGPGFAGAPGPRAEGAPSRPPAFRLFDLQKRFFFGPRIRRPAVAPRIRTFWGPQPPPPPPAMQPSVRAALDGVRLHRRVAALEGALGDLRRQAMRLARWRARAAAGRSVAGQSHGPHPPLRIGHPPGHRRRASREVDVVLRECHLLAIDVLRGDTS